MASLCRETRVASGDGRGGAELAEKPWKLPEGEAHRFSTTRRGRVLGTEGPCWDEASSQIPRTQQSWPELGWGACGVGTRRVGAFASGLAAGGASIMGRPPGEQ